MALQTAGRIERTLFTLDWPESPDLRRRFVGGIGRRSAATLGQ